MTIPDKEREQIAQEMFGKPYAECKAEEHQAIAGKYTGTHYGKKGGETRKEQLGPQGYSEMGTKGGYSTGYAHDPAEQAKHTDRTGNDT